MNAKQPNPPRTARKRTDESLQNERASTDDALAAASNATDAAVSDSRGDADALKASVRDATDAARADVDLLVVEERQVIDDSLAAERHEADAAIERERSLRRALQQSRTFHLEREATDSDLTSERRNTDREMRKSTWLLTCERAALDDARTALATRDELLAIVGHDLRSPLGAILAGTSLLDTGAALGAPGSGPRGLVDGIRRNANGMLRLIGDLLDAERFAAGAFDFQRRSHDLSALARDVGETFALLAMEKSQTLSIEVPEGPVLVSCDGDRIRQVLTNLLDNAIKFTPRNGAIVLTVSGAVGWAHASVCDTGPGIPEAARTRIFDRYSQLTHQRRTGLGLGLYIAKAIIDAHAGQLWVASAAGEGSVFSFALSAAAE